VRLTAVNDASSPVLAAGAVVWRAARDGGGSRHVTAADEAEVLLVHRPTYDDWSFPKGKCDPGEHLLGTAVRETAEESGVAVRLGPPLPQQEYTTGPGMTKRVFYWAARPLDEEATRSFEANREVDEVAWLRLDAARERLTYTRDRAVLDAFGVTAFRAEPLIVLRHGQALPRDSWTGPDRARGLASGGEQEAQRLVPLLAAYGVSRVISSDAVRCTATVQPYASAAGLPVEVDHRLSEEGLRGLDDTAAAERLLALVHGDEPTVVCSHRPVLPVLFAALGVHDPALAPGAFVVVHREGGHVRSVEQHRPCPPH
jgi:8-oxo-(d)GTP phosphatase